VSVVLPGLLFLVVVGGLIALGVRAWRNRGEQEDDGGLDLIPYLLLALAVGVAGFSVARLARVSLTGDRIAGRPTGEIAVALAGLVVAAPVTYLLWRRQAKRRRTYPQTPGWPIYLGLVEAVFLTAFLVTVAQVAESLSSSSSSGQFLLRRPSEWPNLIVYGGIVAFHWWVERRERPHGDAGELPRLVGSTVALITLAVGAVGTLTWLFSEASESLGGTIDVPDPAIPLALLLVSVPIWAFRWLPAWEDAASVFRSLYLSSVTALSLIAAIAAGVTMIAKLIAYLAGQAGPADLHFRVYPGALSFVMVGGAFWLHHRRRLGIGRTGALRGYEYAMAAAGLGTLVGSTTALINAVFEPRLATGNAGEALIALGCTVIASGWVWVWFWRKTQAAPREDEIQALQRRIYLIGMAIVTGLTAAGALIAALVVMFRALLGEGGVAADDLRWPLTLTVVFGLAAWHLFTQIRADSAGLKRSEVKPFTVTITCSHPGNLATMFPKEATVRVLYRGDAEGIIDEDMAAAIVSAVGGSSSLIWVDQDGFRVARARES
jgi:hypothetical protein